MRRTSLLVWFPIALGLTVPGQAFAQQNYRFRFAFGSYCG